MKTEQLYFDLAQLFKIFSDPTRLEILKVLNENKELTVGEIVNKTKKTQSAVSHQLAILKSNNLVKTVRDGQSIIYSLSDEHIEIILNIGIEHITEKE